MSRPSEYALNLQRNIINVDKLTFKTAKLLLDKEKVINELQNQISRLEHQNESAEQLKARITSLEGENAKLRSEAVARERDDARIIELEKENKSVGILRHRILVLERENETMEIMKQRLRQLEKENERHIEQRGDISTLENKNKMLRQKTEELQKQLTTLQDSSTPKVAEEETTSREASVGQQIIPFFSFTRPHLVQKRKIVFSLRGPLKTSSTAHTFSQPENYIQAYPFRLTDEKEVPCFKRPLEDTGSDEKTAIAFEKAARNKKKLKERQSSSSESSEDESEEDRKKKKNKRRHVKDRHRNRRDTSTDSESDEESSSADQKKRSKKRKKRKNKNRNKKKLKKRNKKKSRKKWSSSSSEEESSCDSPKKKSPRKSKNNNCKTKSSQSRTKKHKNSTSESEAVNSNKNQTLFIPTEQLFDYSSSSDETSKNGKQKSDVSFPEKSKLQNNSVSYESRVSPNPLSFEEKTSENPNNSMSAAKSKIAARFNQPATEYIPLGKLPLISTERLASSHFRSKKLSPVPGTAHSEKGSQPESFEDRSTTPNRFLTKTLAYPTSSCNKPPSISENNKEEGPEIRHQLPLALSSQNIGSAVKLQRPIFKFLPKVSFHKPLSQVRVTAADKPSNSLKLPIPTVKPLPFSRIETKAKSEISEPSVLTKLPIPNKAVSIPPCSSTISTHHLLEYSKDTSPAHHLLESLKDNSSAKKAELCNAVLASQAPSQFNNQTPQDAIAEPDQANHLSNLNNREILVSLPEQGAQATEPQSAPVPNVQSAPPHWPNLPDVRLPPPCVSSHGSSKTVPISSQTPPRLDQSDHLADGDEPPDEVFFEIAGCEAARIEPLGESTSLETAMESFIRNQDERSKKLAALKNLSVHEQNSLEESIIFVKSLIGRLWKNHSQDGMADILRIFWSSEPSLFQIRTRIIFQVIYIELTQEKKWENLIKIGPSIPPLTTKQCKIFSFLCLVESEKSFSNVIEKFMDYLEYKLFSKDTNRNRNRNRSRISTYSIFGLANISRIFVTFCKYKGNESRARVFVYNTLFFKDSRTFVLISVFLDTWPEVMMKPIGDGQLEPLAETIIWLVYNTGPKSSVADLKLYEARQKLKEVCGFARHPMVSHEFVKYLISVAKNNFNMPYILDAITKSFLLLAIWNDSRWISHNIISRLLDVLRDSQIIRDDSTAAISQLALLPNAPTSRELFLPWIVDTIGHVSRFCGISNRENLIGIFESVANLLMSRNISQKLENVCVKALVWVGNTLQAQVTKFLTVWHPHRKLDPEVKNLLRDYVGTRGQVFAKNVITGIKKQRLANACRSSNKTH